MTAGTALNGCWKNFNLQVVFRVLSDKLKANELVRNTSMGEPYSQDLPNWCSIFTPFPCSAYCLPIVL